MNTGKALLGILGGMAVGATLGVLFAPEKGAYTRMRISRKNEKCKHEISGKFNVFVDSLTQKFDAMRKEVTRMVENGKGKAEDVAV
jgi:gas vesicle protein